jgi:hypothetical protein
LPKKAIELLDAVTSVPYSRKCLGYTIGRGLDAVWSITCYSYWFSCQCYIDQRGNLMKALMRAPADKQYLLHATKITHYHRPKSITVIALHVRRPRMHNLLVPESPARENAKIQMAELLL